eukprot:Em0016g870a
MLKYHDFNCRKRLEVRTWAGARGDKRHKKNASCVVESPKDDDIIMSEVELDKDTFQKPQKLYKIYKKARKERGKECVIQLLEHKADIHKTAQNGGTPLYFACRHGQLKCVELLLQRGAKVVADRDGVTPLELCAQVLPMMDYLCNSSRQMMTIVLSGLSQKVTTAGMELLRSRNGVGVSGELVRSSWSTEVQKVYQQDQDVMSSLGLEMVWVSLESWFDLLVTEVQKVYQQDQDVMSSLGRLVLNTLGTPARVGVTAVGVSSGDKGEGVPSVTVISPNVGLTNTAEHSCGGVEVQLRGEVKSGVISSGVGGANCTTSDEVPSSNMLAAAIVNSAPLQRRKAYLSNSVSFNGTQPLSSLNPDIKRRSLHLERVAARLLSWQQDSSADPDGFGTIDPSL